MSVGPSFSVARQHTIINPKHKIIPPGPPKSFVGLGPFAAAADSELDDVADASIDDN